MAKLVNYFFPPCNHTASPPRIAPCPASRGVLSPKCRNAPRGRRAPPGGPTGDWTGKRVPERPSRRIYPARPQGSGAFPGRLRPAVHRGENRGTIAGGSTGEEAGAPARRSASRSNGSALESRTCRNARTSDATRSDHPSQPCRRRCRHPGGAGERQTPRFRS